MIVKFLKVKHWQLFFLLLFFASCTQEKFHPVISEALENPESIKRIDLTSAKLKVLPAVLKEFKNLEELYLSDNQFDEVPEFVWTAFPKLKMLNLNHCGITELPTKIDLPNLEWLSLEFNEIGHFPDAFYELKQLQWLSLSYNQFTVLDNKLAQWEGLEELNLSHNRFKEMPDSMANFSKINVLNMGHNDLQSLPPFVGELTSLKRLIANSNEIEELPEALLHLNHLSVLNLDSNKIERIPESFSNLKDLYWIFLSYNKIESLPENMASFPTTLLNLSGNPIPPEQIEDLKENMRCNILF